MEFIGAVLTALFAENLILQGHDIRDGIHLGNRHYPHRIFFFILFLFESLVLSSLAIVIVKFGKQVEILKYISFFIFALTDTLRIVLFDLLLKKLAPKISKEREEDWIELASTNAIMAICAFALTFRDFSALKIAGYRISRPVGFVLSSFVLYPLYERVCQDSKAKSFKGIPLLLLSLAGASLGVMMRVF